MLGVRPAAGRFFSTDEYDAPGHNVVVVSERFADEAFGGASAIGRDVRLNGRPFRIVGIAAEYAGLDPLEPDAVWAPYLAQLSPDGEVQAEPGVFSMVGRLRPGATIEQAQAEVLRASQAVDVVRIGDNSFEPTLFAGITDGIGETRMRLLRIYAILMAGAVTLLALACLNAANLLLARNLRRKRDLVVRGAIGAPRSRLLRELLVESGMLALLAAALGLALSVILVELFRGTQLLSYLPALEDLRIDGRVAAFCAGTAAATLALFAVVPALMASRVDLQRGLRASARATPQSQRLRSVLVATQFALSLALLASAGLMATTVWRLQGLDLGVDTSGVYTFRLAPSRVGHDLDESGAVFQETRRRLEESPGIRSAAVTWSGPFDSSQRMPVFRPGDEAGTPVNEIIHFVSPEYFGALGIPIIAGRTFTQAEDLAASDGVRQVVVNEAFARKWFGTPNATGRSFALKESGDVATVEILGVVGNVRHRELRDGFPPMIYAPAAYQLKTGAVIIRTALGPANAAALVRRVVHEVDPLLPAGELRSIRDDAAVAFTEERLLARLGIVIAALAALLAISGLYAVVASYVNDRLQEFGIRRALGASGLGVVTNVLRRFGVIITAGIALGTCLVFATTRLLASHLYGVSPLDPLTVAAAAFALTFAALLAVWLPSRRALRVDPVVALRAD
jgi:putative ABC transport system permease protein